MKIIDLLNKIANGEEVPKKIFYSDKIWYWDIKAQDYVEDDKRLFNYYIVDELMYELMYDLNDEVEIIEEDKKIEKIPYMFNLGYIDMNDKDIVKKELNETINGIYNKINEIIDVINKGGDNSD